MEPPKSRPSPKMPMKKLQEPKINETDKKVVGELKKLYLETIKLDVDLQREIYNMEKSYEAKHNEIFEKRYKILEDFRKKSVGTEAGGETATNFWLKVLRASYTEFISKKDEKILSHLTDIRSKLYNDPAVKFVIEFHFEPNEYFNNRILTKSYYLNCLPDVDNPLAYDGAEIYKCEGCQIDWKQPHKEKEIDKKTFSSFFEFFAPPTLPEDMNAESYCEINAILQNDFELGFYLKERVIPKAVMFYTGEIADCQTSESDDTDTDDEDEVDAEDEETSEDEGGDDH